jgi:hypothetical protein
MCERMVSQTGVLMLAMMLGKMIRTMVVLVWEGLTTALLLMIGLENWKIARDIEAESPNV